MTDEADILARKLTTMFPDPEVRAEVDAILATYGTARHEQEPTRLRLAILKLAGADLEEIRRHTRYAKEDYRDVLVWAEYPRQGKAWSLPDGPKKQALRDADRRDYETWLGN